MKVIFLDHDGVICLADQWGSRHKKAKKFGRKLFDNLSDLPVEVRFDDFDEKAIGVLNEILQATDVEIVISSDWKKLATLDELGDMYIERGIIKRPIDVTPSIKDLDVPNKALMYRNADLEQERAIEIKHWLSDHPEVTHWVSVDDLNMGKLVDTATGLFEQPWGLDNFVWTPLSREGIKQTGVQEKVLRFLTD